MSFKLSAGKIQFMLEMENRIDSVREHINNIIAIVRYIIILDRTLINIKSHFTVPPTSY